MSLTRLGPFSAAHFSYLKQKLEKNKIVFTVNEDPDLLDAYRLQLKNHEEGRHPERPTYSGIAPEYIFIDLEKENILIIKEDLDKLGVSVLDHAQPESIEEYQCVRCDHYSEAPSLCPKHNIPLITRSEWLKNKGKTGLGGRILSLLIILAFLGFMFFMFSKQ